MLILGRGNVLGYSITFSYNEHYIMTYYRHQFYFSTLAIYPFFYLFSFKQKLILLECSP